MLGLVLGSSTEQACTYWRKSSQRSELIKGFKHLTSDERVKESKENKGRLFSATRDKRDEVEIKDISFYDSITYNIRERISTVSMVKHWNSLPRECSPFGVSVLGDTHNFKEYRPERSAPARPALGRVPGLDETADMPSNSVTELEALISCTIQSPVEKQTHIPSNTCFPELYPPLLPLRRSFTRDRRALRAASTIASLVLPPAVQKNM